MPHVADHIYHIFLRALEKLPPYSKRKSSACGDQLSNRKI